MIHSALKTIATAFFLTTVSCLTSFGQEPGWYPRMIAPPEIRPMIQATPVELRPYRPLHVWGNLQRRTYHRGTVLPSVGDVWQSTGGVILDPRPQAILPPVIRVLNR